MAPPRRLRPLVCALLLIAGSVAAAAADDPATVFLNGRVLTVDERFTVTDALAVRGERIVALGGEAKKLAGGSAVVVDLKGRTLLPGLMDSHAHPVGAAVTEFDHPIPAIETIPQLLDYIAGRAQVLPEGSLIPVRQVFITRLREQRYPTRAELDRVAPRHPVHFSTGPDSMLNSLALQLAGIDREFRLPEGSEGVVVRDAQGEPTGLLHAFSPKIAARSVVRSPDRGQTLELLRALFADYNQAGITTVADRGASASNLELYRSLLEARQLTVRLRCSHTFPTGAQWRTTELALDEVLRHPLRRPDPMLQIIGTKIWLDGGMLTGSALMQQPWGVSQIYGITDPNYRGSQRTPGEHLAKMIAKVSGAGMQFTAHSVGDGAVQLLLEAYEQVDRTVPVRESRPAVTHSNFMAPESIALAARLGVMVDLQPIWFYLDGATLLKQFGMERMSRFQPLRALFDAGVPVGGGSDHMQKIGSLRSVNPYNPWLGMWIAVKRECAGLDVPLHPGGGLTRVEALRMYTSNNARLLFLERETGSLEVGKRADLIVADRDPVECPLDELRGTRVLETWLDGRRIWKAP